MSIALSIVGYALGGLLRGPIHFLLRGVVIVAGWALLLGGSELFCYHFIGHERAPGSLWLSLFLWLVAWIGAQGADESLPTVGEAVGEYVQHRRELREEREMRGSDLSLDSYYSAYENELGHMVADKRVQDS